MLMQIGVETQWWQDGKPFLVPAGETVDVRDVKEIPMSDRPNLKRCIEAHAKRGEDFVPIKIRDWWAIIDRSWLRYPTPTAKPVSTIKPASKPAAPVKAIKPKKSLFDTVPQ